MSGILGGGRLALVGVALALALAGPALAQTETFDFADPGSKQPWNPPADGVYEITAIGATGGSSNFDGMRGGFGARVVGTFTLSQGTTYVIAVGKKGDSDFGDGGGAGGTFFVEAGSPDVPLLIAGGGGGASGLWEGRDATGIGGTGMGGAAPEGAGGGGGFYGDGAASGAPDRGGKSWANGLSAGTGASGSGSTRGGFGGGGAGQGDAPRSGGGGGGYTGGDGGVAYNIGGAGGTSYNAGTDQRISVASDADTSPEGNGRLIIRRLDGPVTGPDGTEASIATFLATRNQLLLSSGPDINQFIDRFSNASTPGTVTVMGYSAPVASAFDLQLGPDAANFSYSSADGVAASDPVSQLAFWAKGDIARASGNTLFGIIQLGADYLVTDNVLLGVAGEIDSMSQEQGDATLSGTGYSVGPYATIRLSDNLFLDARLAGGQSFNSISEAGATADAFIGTRWLGSTSLVGRVDVGSVRIAPTAKLSAITETTGAYVDRDGNDVGAVTATTGTAEIGPRISLIPSDAGGFTPYLGVNGVWTFLSINSAGIAPDAALRARVEAGATLGSAEGMSARTSAWYDGLGTDWQAWGASFGLSAALP